MTRPSASGLLYLCDGAHGLGAALPEHQLVLAVQVLRSLDEAEVDSGLVACAQAGFAHAQDGRRLPDAAAVDCRRGDGVSERTAGILQPGRNLPEECRGDSPMAWYLGDIVVGWWSTRISASNSQVA